MLEGTKRLTYEYLKKVLPPQYRHHLRNWDLATRGDYKVLLFANSIESLVKLFYYGKIELLLGRIRRRGMASNYQCSLYQEYETLHLKHDQLVMEHNLTKEELSWFKTEYYIEVAEKIRLLKQNEELQQEVARLQAKLNIGSNNSSLPVSKTPIKTKEDNKDSKNLS